MTVGAVASSGTPAELAGGTPTPLQRFTRLLGEDVFFVPCEWGTKKPLVTYVERPFEGTKTPAYRALFDEAVNAAFIWGRPREGCARGISTGMRTGPSGCG